MAEFRIVREIEIEITPHRARKLMAIPLITMETMFNPVVVEGDINCMSEI